MMLVRRTNSQETSYSKSVEPLVAAGGKVEIHWGTGSWQRGAEWSVVISSKDFEALARTMVAADSDAALDAFAFAIAKRRSKLQKS